MYTLSGTGASLKGSWTNSNHIPPKLLSKWQQQGLQFQNKEWLSLSHRFSRSPERMPPSCVNLPINQIGGVYPTAVLGATWRNPGQPGPSWTVVACSIKPLMPISWLPTCTIGLPSSGQQMHRYFLLHFTANIIACLYACFTLRLWGTWRRGLRATASQQPTEQWWM